MDRRQFLGSALLALATYRCCASRQALAASSTGGCRTAAASSDPVLNRLLWSSEISIMDTICSKAQRLLIDVLGVRPGVCFYDDGRSRNALAMPDAIPESKIRRNADPKPEEKPEEVQPLLRVGPDGKVRLGVEDEPLLRVGPDGTVLLGVNLLQSLQYCHVPDKELNLSPVLRFPQLMPESDPKPRQKLEPEFLSEPLIILMAHEFGHILQYKNGMSPKGPWQMEPHADFMAGWFLANAQAQHSDGPRTFKDGATRELFKLGDTLFNDPRHHGTPELRAAMVLAGFDSAQLSVADAFEQGREFAGLR